jgi:1,2-diacylglycerol 3-beta-glucosyltransferase
MLLLERIILTLLAVPAVLASAYLFILTLLSAPLARPPRSTRQMRFDVVVPAHNEAVGIHSTVRSLSALDWDKERMRIHVVADNCTDNTAELARQAGARVWERHHAALRGKGYALAYAFEKCLADGWCDAIVVVDADSSVSANLLEAFAARIERGERAVQAHYGIRNPMKSWRTQLMTVAMGAFHIVRSRARDRLGLSSGIRGNGWCVSTGVLRELPYQAFSLTEDLEYGLRLGLGGVRVAYADEASANGDMVSSAQVAGKQRQRWESGRFEMIRKFALPTLASALRRRDAVQWDLALDLLVLPLSYVVMNALLLLLGGLAAWYGGQAEALGFVCLGLACLGALVLHIARGWQVSGTGARGLLALTYAPFYMVWKLAVMLGSKSKEWIRTDRETE